MASGPELAFGTIVHLPGWGPLSVEDRGGVIWDGRIDIWIPSCGDALELGVQYLGGWYVSDPG
jgi:3D (Asp-Asp-Asp) domain-containing protein